MKRSILTVARIVGDLKFTISGEAKTGFSINGAWSNHLSQTLSGDQGNLYPFNKDKPVDCLTILKHILKNIDIVPYQNDSGYEKYACDESNKWIKETLWETVANTLQNHDDVFQVMTALILEGETEPSIVVVVEILSNDYVIGIYNVVKTAQYIGEIIACSDIRDDGSFTITIRNKEDKEAELELSLQKDLYPFDVDSVKTAKHYYTNVNGTHILTENKYDFQLEGSGEKSTV